MNGEWHIFDRADSSLSGLRDHYFYLVTHKDYATPMKAKWHGGMDAHWEVFGCVDKKDPQEHTTEYWYDFDTDNPIVAWMELPDIFKTEFTNEQLGRLDAIQEAAEELLSALAETDDKVWDLDDIWDLIYEGADRLVKKGRRIRIPTHVTMPNGKEFITDWYGEGEDADMVAE